LLLPFLSIAELDSAKKIAENDRLAVLVRNSEAVGANSQLMSTPELILALSPRRTAFSALQTKNSLTPYRGNRVLIFRLNIADHTNSPLRKAGVNSWSSDSRKIIF
jgi:hypothetical protein